MVNEKNIGKFYFAAVLVFVISLSGCDKDVSKNISLPSLPVIQEAVKSLSPVIDGKRNDKVMAQICNLAQGQSSLAQVGLALKEEGILLADIPPQGHQLSMIYDNDKVRLVRACAAYLATSVLSPPNYNDLMLDSESAERDSDAPDVQRIDPNKLRALLGARLAIARVNADIYAYIASELELINGLSLDKYQEKSALYFSRLAPLYLQRVNALYAQSYGDSYRLVEGTENRFVFTSASGFHFENTDSQIFLRYKTIPWLGGSYLMGSEYKISTGYFGSEWYRASKGLIEGNGLYSSIRDYKIVRPLISWLNRNYGE